MRCVAYYHMLDNVMPCPDAVTLNISKRASSLLRRPHALSTVICVSVVSPSLALIMVYCAVCSLLVHRVCHHRQHQVIPPLPRLAGPPAPSYRWINEMRYGDLHSCTLSIATVHISVAAVRCTLLPCVLACVVCWCTWRLCCVHGRYGYSLLLVICVLLSIRCG